MWYWPKYTIDFLFVAKQDLKKEGQETNATTMILTYLDTT